MGNERKLISLVKPDVFENDESVEEYDCRVMYPSWTSSMGEIYPEYDKNTFKYIVFNICSSNDLCFDYDSKIIELSERFCSDPYEFKEFFHYDKIDYSKNSSDDLRFVFSVAELELLNISLSITKKVSVQLNNLKNYHPIFEYKTLRASI